MIVKNAVYLTEDKSEAVPHGDPRAASLFVGARGMVSDEDAKRYKLTESGASGQKDEKSDVPSQFRHAVTDNTPDGVNTAPDSPAAQGLVDGGFAIGTSNAPALANLNVPTAEVSDAPAPDAPGRGRPRK